MNPVRFVVALLACSAMASLAVAQQSAPSGAEQPDPPARRSVWNGYERIDFYWAKRPCVLIIPKEAAPGKPWIWRTEFFDHQPQVDLAMLAKGWHVAYMNASNLYGAPKAIALFNEFYAHLVIHAQLSRRVVLEGFSRGGLYAINFAATHPTRVAALYLDAPVVDLNSWPRKKAPKQWAEALEAYNVPEAAMDTFKGNPINRIGMLIGAKIPIIAVCGDADDVVPYAENMGVIEKRYKEAGAPIQVILKPGGNHHPHSLEDPTPVVEFLMNNARP